MNISFAEATPALNVDDLLRDVPPGAWVAISQDHSRVVAYGIDLRDVIESAKQNGEYQPLLIKSPETKGALVL